MAIRSPTKIPPIRCTRCLHYELFFKYDSSGEPVCFDCLERGEKL